MVRDIVAGVDVGSEHKGFHAVALRNGVYSARFQSRRAADVASWCREIGAWAIGVDAPCRWSATGGARPAERALMRQGISCFCTPSREVAVAHPKRYFAWMLNGENLFGELEKTHRLFNATGNFGVEPTCFETFPQAVACALSGKVVSAKRKATVRRALLGQVGVATKELDNIDWIDAALCAVAASAFVANLFFAYGEEESGFILVPRVSKG